MDPPSSSSPRRDDAAPQDELEQIASQMEWDNEANVGAQSAEMSLTSMLNLGTRMALGLKKALG